MSATVAARPLDDDVSRIVVRLPNWLGDTVMAVPALRSLRAAFPAASLLAAGPWASILTGQQLADVMVAYPRSWSGRLRTADVVRRFGGAVAIVLPNSFESALAACYWRAGRRVGFAAGGRDWLLTDPLPMPSPRLHQVDEYLRLVASVGVPPVASTPELSAPGPRADSRETIRSLLARAGVARSDGSAIVGVHLGAAYGASKLWPSERVVQLVAELRRDAAVAVLLGPAESTLMAEEIVNATGVPSLVGLDNADVLPALLTEIDVLVGGDTGVSHLAAALGTRVVALFGPTDPALTAPRGRTVIVRHSVPCSPCFYRACPIDHPCMRGIGADEVHAAVHEVRAAAHEVRADAHEVHAAAHRTAP